MARPCPRWRHVWRHMHRDAVTSLPSSVSLPFAQNPTALIRASREHKSLAETLFCAFTASSAASRRVINTAQWKRSCSPLPAAAPWHTARHEPVWVSPSPALPLCRGQSAVRAGRAHAMPGPCAQGGTYPRAALAHPCSGAGGGEGGREEMQDWVWSQKRCRMQEGFGRKKASLKCCLVPLLPPTPGARAGVYTHGLTRTCHLFFLDLSTAEQLKQTALQQAAPQSTAFQ